MSLIPNLSLFRLTQNELRIQSLTELSSITLEAQCNILNTGFEFELSNTLPETWIPAPITASGIFTNINNQCASSGKVTFVLDLSATAPFSTLSMGASQLIKVRDLNSINFSTTETLKITYSAYSMPSKDFILGQGVNNPLCSGSFCLRGRLTAISNLTPEPATSGSYTLQGKVIFK